MLDAAEELNDLKVPPGNKLEPLKGDRKGRHSIRINAQWRICFIWKKKGPEDVEIVDYHRRKKFIPKPKTKHTYKKEMK